MNYVDLHVHSNASDGTCTPTEVVRLAAGAGLKAIALTDHDTTAGIFEALEAGNAYGVEVVPGIEVSCSYQGREIHVLGLFVTAGSPALEAVLREFRQRRDQRNEEMFRRFAADGITFTMEELCGGNPDTVITRAHVARALLAKGIAASREQVFQKYLKSGGPYCPPKAYADPAKVLNALLSDGAFPALAHPFQYKLGGKETKELIGHLASLGMKGLEVYHSSNNRLESMKLREMASAFGLLPTGGSDFHGSNKPDISIGRGRGGLKVSSLLLEDIKKAL